MSKTIEQLRAQAAQIEEATRQGENTQIRVGGLFTDVIDFIAQIPITETVLGPLLQALNNSQLLEPSDGQTLTFSIMKDSWTYSDALTQLKLSINGIEQTVTSNYEAFLLVKDQLQREVAATDQRVRNYKTDYDNSQIEYATWKSQTDTQISQYAVAIDKNTGDIISISGRVDTAYDQLDFVTNDLEAADRAIGKLFDLTGMELTDDPSASWLYKNRAGIYGAAATFDEEGNIKQSSKLQVTINGIETEVSNATGQISSIKQSVDSIQLAVAGSQQQITTLSEAVNGSPGHPGILDRLSTAESGISGYADSASWIQQNRDSISATVGYFDSNGKLVSTAGLVETGDFASLFTAAYDNTGAETAIARISAGLEEKVDSEGVRRIISTVHISADQIDMKGSTFEGWFNDYISLNADDINFKFTNRWSVRNANDVEVMWLDPYGNLTITGILRQASIEDTMNVGSIGGRRFVIGAADSNGRAFITGYDGTDIDIAIGWQEANPRPRITLYDDPYFDMYDSSDTLRTSIRCGSITLRDSDFNGLDIEVKNKKILISPSNNTWWLTESEVQSMASGYVYIDSNKHLRVR